MYVSLLLQNSMTSFTATFMITATISIYLNLIASTRIILILYHPNIPIKIINTFHSIWVSMNIYFKCPCSWFCIIVYVRVLTKKDCLFKSLVEKQKLEVFRGKIPLEEIKIFSTHCLYTLLHLRQAWTKSWLFHKWYSAAILHSR